MSSPPALAVAIAATAAGKDPCCWDFSRIRSERDPQLASTDLRGFGLVIAVTLPRLPGRGESGPEFALEGEAVYVS